MLLILKQAARDLRRMPVFSAIIVATLALGIGATTTIYSVVNGVLLAPYPFPASERLRILWQRAPGVGVEEDWLSPAQYFDIREQVTSFEAVAIASGGHVVLTGDEMEPERVGVLAVSSSFFDVLGIEPVAGRRFTPDDDGVGSAPKVVIGQRLFVQRYGADPEVVGTKIAINGQPFEIVGVLPPLDLGADIIPTLVPAAHFDLLISLSLADPQITTHGSENFNVIGKLSPTATPVRLATELRSLAEQFSADEGSLAAGLAPDSGYLVDAVPLHEEVVGEVRRPLLMLLGGTGLLLAVACANVANLLLTRNALHRRHLSLVVALGIPRRQLVARSLCESSLLAGAAGALGVGVAVLAVQTLRATALYDVPRLQVVSVDFRVLLFAAAVSLAATLLFGVGPALRSVHVAPYEMLIDSGAGLGPRSVWRRGGARYLVVAQVALSLMLLAGASLLVRTLENLRGVDPGFRPDGALTFQASLLSGRYNDPAARRRFFTQLFDRLRKSVGVEEAGGSTLLPLTDLYSWTDFAVEGHGSADDRSRVVADEQIVTPGYFRAMGIPLLAGRSFGRADGSDTLVAIVDRKFAERFWSIDEAVGKWVLRYPGEVRATVVGVVESVKHYGLSSEPRPTVFYPHRAFSTRTLYGVIRSEADPSTLVPELLDSVGQLDPDLPVSDIRTMGVRIEESLGRHRAMVVLLNLFGGIALAVATVGLYGVLSFAVATHVHELGVRVALGARKRHLYRLVVGRAGTLTALGILIGTAAAIAAGRIFEGLVYGVSSTDPLSLTAAAGLVLVVAIAVSSLPARRAARVDPMRALKID